MGNEVDITEVADGSKPNHESIGLDETCIIHLAIALFHWFGDGGERSLQNECNS